jgi:AraC family transcriptional regulator
MITYRIVDCPAFEVVGWKTWISGQDNELFGRFWEKCRAEGLFDRFAEINGLNPGRQTKGMPLGISCVDQDPAKREFFYMIAVEKPEGESPAGLETYPVPAVKWVIFECRGKIPEAIVQSEIFAFMEWLPSSGYVHAHAPEMEVYFPENDGQSDNSYCEFWLPIEPQSES